MIKFTKKEDSNFQDIKFVLSAKSKDNIKPVFYHAYYDSKNKKLVCTDSRRLHLCDLDDNRFKDGLYRVIKSKSINEITLEYSGNQDKFPDYNQIIPKMEPLKTTSFYIGGDKTGVKKSIAIQKVYNLVGLESTLNFDFLNDILKNADDYTVEYFSKTSPVKFTNCSKLALIMPILTNNE